MRDAVSDHPRLAAACSGEQQQWSFHVRNGLFLLRIEAFKKIHEEGLQECGVGPGDPLLKTVWMGGTEDGIQSYAESECLRMQALRLAVKRGLKLA